MELAIAMRLHVERPDLRALGSSMLDVMESNPSFGPLRTSVR